MHRVRFRTGFHLRRCARGGLVRSTARTPRSLLCKPGTVTKVATAATRPLSLVRHRLCRTLTRTFSRALTLTHSTMALGHAVVPSRIPTAISLSYRDLTHAVSFTHGASPLNTFSLTHRASSIHGVSLTHGESLTHAITLTHGVSLTHLSLREQALIDIAD